MQLYKFLPADFALWDLTERKLKISEFHDMNDPFELRGIGLSDPVVHQLLIADAVKHNGVLCLSRGWNNPVLWSHYADKHKGMCLGFDVGSTVEVQEPIYVETWQQHDADILLSAVARGATTIKPSDPAFQNAQELIMKLLLTKFKAWSYENEARIFLRLKEDQKQGGLYFADFDEHIRPNTLILGPRCSIAASKIADATSGYTPPITVIQAMLSPTSFEVIGDVLGSSGAR